MKERPEIRIVGNASEEIKAKHKKRIEDLFSEHLKNQGKISIEQLKKHEIEKTEEQIRMIEIANEESNLLMESLGLEAFDVSPDNIHVLGGGALKDFGYGDELVGKTFLHRQGVLLFDQDLQNNPLYFATTVFHEILHLKGHITMEVGEEGNETTIGTYRGGLLTYSSSKKDKEEGQPHIHFNGLNEAVVAYAERIAMIAFESNQMFQEEVDWMNSGDAPQIKREYAIKNKISENDVMLVAKLNTRHVADDGTESMEVKAISASYPKHVELLRYVISEIQKEFPEKYKNNYEVFDEFIKSNFTGQLLTIARLVEKTFGEGSFRSLGEVTNESRSAILKLETFKRLRSKFLKEKEGKK